MRVVFVQLRVYKTDLTDFGNKNWILNWISQYRNQVIIIMILYSKLVVPDILRNQIKAPSTMNNYLLLCHLNVEFTVNFFSSYSFLILHEAHEIQRNADIK